MGSGAVYWSMVLLCCNVDLLDLAEVHMISGFGIELELCIRAIFSLNC